MKKETNKIAIGFFVVLVFGLLYLSLSLEKENEYQISVVRLEGNLHLSASDYFEYAGLNDEQNYRNLTLRFIRDRIQKHPYTKTAKVEYEGKGVVKIKITEKNFKALILTENDKFLLTEEVEILPVADNTYNIDYPVIRMSNKNNELRVFTFPKSNLNLETAYKILSAARLMNPDLYDNLSEVDLRSKNNVVLYFSSVDYPVILGAENEIKKMVVFEKLWENLSTVQANKLLDYVDLRFKDKIYLGLAGDNLEEEETSS